ncbi:MAG TPA: multidrug effflux MFS transporter [Xanthobacteraceae bacterium]|nr:multidrug effflux MFS transporter [Xanthobacteraceae bacterium]
MLRPESRATTILLAMLTGVPPFATSMFMPSLPDISRSLSASPAEVQLSITAYLVGLAIGQIFYGPFADKYGRKLVMLVAMAIFSLATLLCALAPNIEILMLGRALQAVGGAGAIVITRAMVRDTHDGVLAARELALMASFMSISPIVAPILGGVLQTASGWRSTFVVLLIFGLLLTAAFWLLLGETLKHRTQEPLSFGSVFRTFGTFLRSPMYLANIALGAGAFAGGYAWLSGSSFILQDLHHLTPLQFSLVFAISSVGFLIGNTLAARFVMRRGIGFTVLAGCSAIGLASAMLLAAMTLGYNSVTVLTACAVVYLAGQGLVMPQTMAASLMAFPRAAGAASSLAGFIQQGCGGISAAVVGYYMGQSEWPVVWGMVLMGAFVVVVGFATHRMRTPKPALHGNADRPEPGA